MLLFMRPLTRFAEEQPAVDQTKYGIKEKLRDCIRHERRVEFAMEGRRYTANLFFFF